MKHGAGTFFGSQFHYSLVMYINSKCFAPSSTLAGWLQALPDVRRECSGVPGPTGLLHGDGPAPGPLLHKQLPQHLSIRSSDRRQEFRGDVPPDPFGRMSVCGAGLLERKGGG